MRYFDGKIVSDPGSPIKDVFSPKVDKSGNVELVVTGKENTDEFIQSFAESTDMQVIISRYMAGDTTVLNQRTPTFGDFTNMPQTYAEFLQLQIDSNRLFESLPNEIKKQFDNDANKFFAQAGQTDWYEKVAPVLSDEMRSMINNMNTVEDMPPVHDGEEVKVGE